MGIKVGFHPEINIFETGGFKVETSKWITNVRVVAETGIIEQGSVCVENGRITAIVEGALVHSEGLEILDGEGKLLIPGMIDVHIHGAKGYDMMDGTVRSIEVVSETCAVTGCTSFLATSVSSKMEDLLQMIDNVKKVAGKERGASIVGIHTEGPYLNITRKGMQNEAFLRHPDITEMERVVEQAGSLLKMVSINPSSSMHT